MIKQKKLFFGAVSILVILTVVFIEKEDFRQEKLKFTRAFNKISYFLEDQLAGVIYSNEHIKIPVTFIKQEHALTCEIAALRMTLNYLGVKVTENELLKELAFDTDEPKTPNNVWGDPDKGFVGDINGSIFLGTGYGVYEKPIRNLALKYRTAVVFEKTDLHLILEEIDNGNPVLVWGLLSDKDPFYWQTKEGKTVTAFPGEHARIVIGYSGNISNPHHLILMDPIYGKIRMNTGDFLSDWKTLGNKAVVVF